jgi:hypothetical protein
MYFARSATFTVLSDMKIIIVRGKLPRTAGWQPALPKSNGRIGEAFLFEEKSLFHLRKFMARKRV